MEFAVAPQSYFALSDAQSNYVKFVVAHYSYVPLLAVPYVPMPYVALVFVH